MINALNAGKAVNIGTKSNPGNGLVGGHAYAVTAYDAATQRFTLFNPWNSTHPGPLTWLSYKPVAVGSPRPLPPAQPIVSSNAFAGAPQMRSEVPA